MKTPLFTGVCTALVTPFIGDQVNYPMMEMLLKRQMDAGIKAVVIAGTTGEAPTLTDQEKITMFRRAKEYTGNRMTVIAGTGSNSTAHALHLSREAEREGVDALLVVSPYYNKTTADGLVEHYRAIAGAVKIPVILYNVPGRTGQDIPVAVYRQLSKIHNIAGVKEASADITKITKIRAACGSGFSVWTGNDELITPAAALGASGVISVLSNALPEETACMTEAALAGDLDTASALQTYLQPLIEGLFREVNPIPVKQAMALLGYDCGPCRPPLTTMTQAAKEALAALLQR